MTRKVQQELCIALGMQLKDGSKITVGGEMCPPVARIAERMMAMGVEVVRIGKDQRSDNIDDAGMYQTHYVSNLDSLPETAQEILARDSGIETINGDDVMGYLLTSWPATALSGRTK